MGVTLPDQLWYVSKDEDGYYSSSVAAYATKELAQQVAAIANDGLGYEEYSAGSIPYMTALPRVERTLRLRQWVTEDDGVVHSEESQEVTVHFDPTEQDENPTVEIRHSRDYLGWGGPLRPVIVVTARGNDHDAVRVAVADRVGYLKDHWPHPIWTATYDDLSILGYDPHTQAATGARGRRQTHEFADRDAAIEWLAREWIAERIGVVSLEVWPSGVVMKVEDLHAELQAFLESTKDKQ